IILNVFQTSEASSVNKCLQFDGIDDVVNAGDINAFDSSQFLTTEMWVRIDKFDAWRTFFCKFQNLANRIQFQLYNAPGKIAVCVNNNANINKEGNQAYYYTPDPEVTIGDWFHLAMVFDGTLSENERQKLYINGMRRPLTREASAKGVIPTHMPQTSASLLLGAEKENGAFGFKGLMDEIRIWNVARSADEIRTNIESSLTGEEDGLILYYPVHQSDVSTEKLTDNSSQKQHAKLINFNNETCFVDRIVAVPVVAATHPEVTYSHPDGIRIAWVRGSGSANLVFATDSEIGLPQPERNVTYIANQEYGKGSRIGVTNWYCVYNGYDASASIKGLSPSTGYRLAVVDYNGASGSELYTVDSTAVFTVTTVAHEKKPQQITFLIDSAIVEGHGPVVLSGTAQSGLPLTFLSSDSSILRIKDGMAYPGSPGIVSVTASQTGDNDWLPAADVTRTVIIKEDLKVPTVKSSSANLKKTKPLIIGGGVLIGTGLLIGIIAAFAGNDNSESNQPAMINDRPPHDPVMSIVP
ncbi:MAG: LamG domain-containing protein, partial [Fibrobacter sp.]|nr:LamG domain-containing protein [Fibrobacter sp.]